MLGTAVIVAFSTSLAVQAAEPLRVQMIGYFDALQYLEDTVITAFEKKYDVDVQFERVTWANRQEKLVVSTAAGTPPDVFMNGAENVVDLVNNGFVAPIDKYIAKWPDLRDFSPATMQNSALNGHQYGVPLYTDTRSFWYRTDFFEEAGLDPNKPPTNWEQLLNAARRLTRTEGNTVVRQGFDLARWTGKTSGLQDYVVYLWQNGGELINTGKYEALFNGTKGIEAMQFMLDLQDAVRPPGYTVDAGIGSGSPIVRGKAAMNLNTGAVVSESYKYDPEVANRIRAIVPPFGQSNRVSVTFSNWLAIHSDS
jgi:multiple sugar transport system substrate-binding protein